MVDIIKQQAKFEQLVVSEIEVQNIELDADYQFVDDALELKQRISNSVQTKKGLSFISNRQRRKEGTICASGLAGIEPTPPAPEEQGMCAFRQLG